MRSKKFLFMRKTKRWFVIAVAMVSILALAGCSNSASGSGGGAPNYRELSTAQVGDIIFKNGKVLSAAEMTDELKNDAIAVVYKVDAANKKAWAVGKVHESTGLVWAKLYATGHDKIENLITKVKGSKGNLTFSGTYLDGSTGLTELKKVATDYNDGTKYPAWAWVEKYGATNCAGTAFTTGWYFPSVAELFDIWKNKSDVETALEKSGGNKFEVSEYWSSSQFDTIDEFACYLKFENGDWGYRNKSIAVLVCAVRAFTY